MVHGPLWSQSLNTPQKNTIQALKNNKTCSFHSLVKTLNLHVHISVLPPAHVLAKVTVNSEVVVFI